MADYEAQIKALKSLTVDDVSELYNKVRTASGRVHDRDKFTVVVRHDDEGNPIVGDVMQHQQGSHFRPEGDNVATTITFTGHPFLSRDEFKRHFNDKIQRDIHATKGRKAEVEQIKR